MTALDGCELTIGEKKAPSQIFLCVLLISASLVTQHSCQLSCLIWEVMELAADISVLWYLEPSISARVQLDFNLIAKLIPSVITFNIYFSQRRKKKEPRLCFAIKKVMKYSVYVSSLTKFFC